MAKRRERFKSTAALVAKPKYEGKYVAVDKKNGNEIVAFGQSLGRVLKNAQARGVKAPAVIFVP